MRKQPLYLLFGVLMFILQPSDLVRERKVELLVAVYTIGKVAQPDIIGCGTCCWWLPAAP
jgi:hypothetical protein